MTATGLRFASLIGMLLLAACGQETATVAPAAQEEAAPVDAALVDANFAPTGTLRVAYLSNCEVDLSPADRHMLTTFIQGLRN